MERRSRTAVVVVVALLASALALVPGRAVAITAVDLAHDWSTRVDGGSGSENLGGSVANAGDVNGDGVDDLLVGAVNGSNVFVVYGQPDARSTVLNAGSLTDEQGYRISGPLGSNTGFSVANAGDVNGDGVPDALVGLPSGAFIVFGQRTASPVTVQLSDIGTPGNTQGYAISGGANDEFVGSSGAGIGDVNGDGVPDVLVGGMSSNHNGRMTSGSAWVVFGQRGSVATVQLGTLSPAQGYRIDGAEAGDELGGAAASAGDVNGDGIPDLLLGADERSFQGRSDSGSAYLVYGRRSVATPVDLALLTAAQGYEMGGASMFQGAGNAVASAGDLDGDGVPDALVGAPSSGQAYVVFGQGSNASTIDLADVGTTGNDQGTRIDPPFSQSSLGTSVASGDVNGDRIPDAIVGDGGATFPPGEGYVVFGRRPSPERIETDVIGVTPGNGDGFVLLNTDGGLAPSNGFAIADAGDLDGDGAADVALTAPFNSRASGPPTEGAAWTTLTALVLPIAATGPAADVVPGEATLTGTVNTDAATCASAGTPTTSHFEFGPTTAYGSETQSVTAGQQIGDVPVSAPLTGLAAGTYHDRLVAECADGGRFFGADRTFTVPAAPPTPGGGGGSSGSGSSSNGSSSSAGAGTSSGASAGATPSAPVTPSSAATTVGLAIAGVSRVALVRHGVALVKLRCSAPAGTRCRGVLVLSAGPRLGRAAYAIAAGRRKTVKVRLSAAGLARVAGSARGLRVKATTTTRQRGTSGKVRRSSSVVLRPAT
jgi:hypothetical protein